MALPIKFAFLAGGIAGKTSLILSFKAIAYVENNINNITIEENFSANVTRKGKNVSLDITEIGGQFLFDMYNHVSWHKLNHLFESMDVIVILFSLVEGTSTPDSPYGVSELYTEYFYSGSTKPIVLVGTMSDRREERTITYCQGLAKATEIGAFKYLECSSKNMEGVTQVFKFWLHKDATKEDKIENLVASIQSFKGNKEDLDDQIISLLKEEAEIFAFTSLDFYYIFTKGLNKVAMLNMMDGIPFF